MACYARGNPIEKRSPRCRKGTKCRNFREVRVAHNLPISKRLLARVFRPRDNQRLVVVLFSEIDRDGALFFCLE